MLGIVISFSDNLCFLTYRLVWNDVFGAQEEVPDEWNSSQVSLLFCHVPVSVKPKAPNESGLLVVKVISSERNSNAHRGADRRPGNATGRVENP